MSILYVTLFTRPDTTWDTQQNSARSNLNNKRNIMEKLQS